MDGLLLEECRTELDIGDWMKCVHELRAELTQLRDEVAALRRENLQLRQQVGYWKSMQVRALERVAVLEQENELLRGENRRLQQQAFGKKSEKQSPKDRSNQLEGFDDKDSSELVIGHAPFAVIATSSTLTPDATSGYDFAFVVSQLLLRRFARDERNPDESASNFAITR